MVRLFPPQAPPLHLPITTEALMKFYIEFQGYKITKTECYNYEEARYFLTKILDQCMHCYKRKENRKLSGAEEFKMQYKILSKLRLVRTK